VGRLAVEGVQQSPEARRRLDSGGALPFDTRGNCLYINSGCRSSNRA
jgi:hypothetical protein